MAEKTTPPPNYLRHFKDPIWTRLKLEQLTALSLVEVRRNGLAFTVLELEHRGIKQHHRQISLVFMVPVPDPSRRWKATYCPQGMRVWVDAGHVYLTRLAQHTPVKEWNAILERATRVVDTLGEVPAEHLAAYEDSPLKNPADSAAIQGYLVVAGLLPGMEALHGLQSVSALLKSGFIQQCASDQPWAKVVYGGDAWVYALALCLPLLGHLKAAHTVARHIGRRHFSSLIALDGVLTVALAAGGLMLALPHFPKALSLSDGTRVSCYGNVPNQRATPTRTSSDIPEFKVP